MLDLNIELRIRKRPSPISVRLTPIVMIKFLQLCEPCSTNMKMLIMDIPKICATSCVLKSTRLFLRKINDPIDLGVSCRFEQCGCINPFQWNARTIIRPPTNEIIVANLCNISDPCYSRAAETLLTSNDLMRDHCSYCPEQCSITSFNLQSSVWKAPASWLMNDIKRFVESTDIPLPNDWSTQWRSHIESSYLSVELIHESSIVENYTQKATLSPVDVLSNVGGQTGLWIGVSFLSLMEFAEMVFRLLQYQWDLFRLKRRTIAISETSSSTKV